MTPSFFRHQFQLHIVLVLVYIMVVWILVEYTGLLYKSYQIDHKKQWFISENERLIAENDRLERQYQYNKTDYFFRKEAKRKLNKKEPGEQVIIVTGGDSQVAALYASPDEEDNVERWAEYLFGDD